MAGAQRACRLHVLHLAHHQHRGAHDACSMRRGRDGQRDDHVEHRCAHDGADGDGQNDGRKGHEGVHQPHDRSVGAAEVTGRGADHDARDAGDQCHQETDLQRDARAVQHARQDVAPEMVGAHPVLRRWRQHAGAQAAFERVERRDGIGQQRQHRDQAHQHQADGEGAVGEQPPCEGRARGRRRGRGRCVGAQGGGCGDAHAHPSRTRGSITAYNRSTTMLTTR